MRALRIVPRSLDPGVRCYGSDERQTGQCVWVCLVFLSDLKRLSVSRQSLYIFCFLRFERMIYHNILSSFTHARVVSNHKIRCLAERSQLFSLSHKTIVWFQKAYTFTFIRRFYPERLTVYYIFLSVHVFPGNRTHNLCAADAMLYHWATGTLYIDVLMCPFIVQI